MSESRLCGGAIERNGYNTTCQQVLKIHEAKINIDGVDRLVYLLVCDGCLRVSFDELSEPLDE